MYAFLSFMMHSLQSNMTRSCPIYFTGCAVETIAGHRLYMNCRPS